MSIQRAIRPRLRSRPLLGAVAMAVVLMLLAHPLAAASDALSNVAPASQLPARSLTNAYPLGNYALDHHFDAVSTSLAGGIDASGIEPTIAWFLAQLVWSLTAFLANAVITLFTFAFSLDLVNGSAATGGAGALGPVAVAVRSIYRDTFGEPWLVVAILLTGLWAIWHALVRRKYTETAGALAVSLAFVVIALALVARPEIVGQASKWTNRMSGAFLALSTQGSLGGAQQAKQADADQLFHLLIYEPWTVLEFGGIEHCVTTSGNPQSVPIRPLSSDPARDGALSRQLADGTQVQADGKLCINNANKYAHRFLTYAPDSAERDAEYELLKDGGKLGPIDLGQRGTYRLGPADKPAADAMGKGGQDQRLLLAIVVFVGELGAFGLLGSASVVVIVAQILMLLLLAFAPVALVAGVVPGRGHDFFKGWLARLAAYLLRKAIYSLVLAVLLTVDGALADASASLGWLLAFGLQAVFFWTVLLNRRQLLGQLSQATAGPGRVESDGLGRAALVTYAAARFATRQLRRRGSSGEQAGGERGGGKRGGRRPGGAPPAPGAPGAHGPKRGGPSAPPAAPSGVPKRPRPDRPAAPSAIDRRRAGDAGSATATPAPARGEHTPRGGARAPVAGSASAGEHDGREDRRSPTGKPAAAEHAQRARRGSGSDGESALRRGLHEDARRLRRESHRLREDGQQLADEGRRLRSGARHAHAVPAPVASPRRARHVSPVEPAGPPPAPLDSAGEETPA